MSGHSKWAGIKHKKAIVDAKRGKAFTQVANMISVAARSGGGDPSMNFKLRLAIDKARAVNMPQANIERAIKRGTGEGGGARIEETIYEGYGPGGIALLIETASDNKNRTVSDIRSTLTKYGGSMASTGSVAYIFDQKGQLEIKLGEKKIPQDDLELMIIESGASDFEAQDDHYIVYAEPADLKEVKDFLDQNGLSVDSAELTYIPKTEIKITDESKAGSVIKLMNALEDLDDITSVHSNFDIPEEILNKF
ncbi:MAG: YebC/PmpR family DNA-binding transcriptional regulator [Patescibacteria group bacterium]|nr:YebC/PmpR family DNA-binding transcriptional regulator [Patescibacteria group bacterium]